MQTTKELLVGLLSGKPYETNQPIFPGAERVLATEKVATVVTAAGQGCYRGSVQLNRELLARILENEELHHIARGSADHAELEKIGTRRDILAQLLREDIYAECPVLTDPSVQARICEDFSVAIPRRTEAERLFPDHHVSSRFLEKYKTALSCESGTFSCHSPALTDGQTAIGTLSDPACQALYELILELLFAKSECTGKGLKPLDKTAWLKKLSVWDANLIPARTARLEAQIELVNRTLFALAEDQYPDECRKFAELGVAADWTLVGMKPIDAKKPASEEEDSALTRFIERLISSKLGRLVSVTFRKPGATDGGQGVSSEARREAPDASARSGGPDGAGTRPSTLESQATGK